MNLKIEHLCTECGSDLKLSSRKFVKNTMGEVDKVEIHFYPCECTKREQRPFVVRHQKIDGVDYNTTPVLEYGACEGCFSHHLSNECKKLKCNDTEIWEESK